MKKTYKVKGMDCISCAMLIEADLEDAGIKAKVNFAKEDLEVEKDDPKKIKEVVENLGYSLQEQ